MSPRIDLRQDRLRWPSRLLLSCARTIRYRHLSVGKVRDLCPELSSQRRLGLDGVALALLFVGGNLFAQQPVPIQNWPANGVYDDSGGTPPDLSTADGPAQEGQEPVYREQPLDGPQNDQQQAYANPD